MGKNLATCVTYMVEGMLPDIQREVLMKAPGGVEEMLTHAKLADTVYNRPTLAKNAAKISHFREEKIRGETKNEVQGMVHELKQLALDMNERKEGGHINCVQANQTIGQNGQRGQPRGQL